MAKRDNDEAKKAIGLIAELYLETYMKYTAQLGDPALALTLTNAFIEKLLSSVMPNGKTTTIFWDNSEE